MYLVVGGYPPYSQKKTDSGGNVFFSSEILFT